MPIGSARIRGFIYLAALFLVALTAAGLAALGQSWSTAAQRERERELGFRGAEIARALASYAKATPNPPQQYPKTLDELLVDRRGLKPRHHLRRLYADPFTGLPDWVLVPEPGQPGAFSAVHSRSVQALLRETSWDGSAVKQAADLVFAARAFQDSPQPQAVAASAPPGAASGPSRAKR